MSTIKPSGIGIKDKIGYAMGDVGMQFLFGLVSSVLQKYYTDILRIPVGQIMLLFIIARIWDAVNDPLWGTIIDTRPINRDGRYRRWIKYMTIPMAIATVLMFVKIPNMSTTGYFIYACVTYTMFGMIYTTVNVPYGSMASVISADDSDRSALSVFRSVGSALGTIPALLLITLCYVKDDAGNKVMSYPRIIVGVAIIAGLGAIACILCYYWTKERVISAPKAKTEKHYTIKTVGRIMRSGPFWIVSLSAMLFLAALVFSQSYFTYLADKYFNMPALSMLTMVCQYLPILGIMFFIGKLNAKFGRKELCAYGMLIAGIFNLILYFMHTTNPWIFLLFCFLSGIGNSFIFLQVWALATEVIDYNEVKFGVRDEATCYSVFSFIRKLGHAIAAIFVNASLLEIGYSVDNITPEALEGMYASSVLVPAVLYLAVFVLLQFFYPLNKKRLALLQIEKTKIQ